MNCSVPVWSASGIEVLHLVEAGVWAVRRHRLGPWGSGEGARGCGRGRRRGGAGRGLWAGLWAASSPPRVYSTVLERVPSEACRPPPPTLHKPTMPLEIQYVLGRFVLRCGGGLQVMSPFPRSPIRAWEVLLNPRAHRTPIRQTALLCQPPPPAKNKLSYSRSSK